MNSLVSHVKRTSLGWLAVVASAKGLRWIFLSPNRKQALFEMKRQFPHLDCALGKSAVHKPPVIEGRIFEGWIDAVVGAVEQPDKAWQAPLDISGTSFQRGVWKALQGIPAGSVWTYGQLAAHLGRPRAARAVGSACGANPVPFLVPCHRVVASNGGLGGFGLGLDIKRALLKREGVRY